MEVVLFDDLFKLRAGLNSLLLDDREREFSLGFGIKSPVITKQQFQINYSFESLKYLGDTHQVSFGFVY